MKQFTTEREREKKKERKKKQNNDQKMKKSKHNDQKRAEKEQLFLTSTFCDTLFIFFFSPSLKGEERKERTL